jgi:hypothetical protein
LGKNIKGNITNLAKDSLGLCERKQHKAWFDVECLHYTDQRMQAEVQRLLDQKENNANNLNNVMHEAIRYFRGKSRDYLKVKINGVDTNSKNKNIRGLYRGISDFTKG